MSSCQAYKNFNVAGNIRLHNIYDIQAHLPPGA